MISYKVYYNMSHIHYILLPINFIYIITYIAHIKMILDHEVCGSRS